MVRCGCGGSAGERCQNCPAWIGLGGGAVQGHEGVVGDEVVVQWEIGREISSVGLSEGLQGDGEHDHEGAMPVDGALERWSVG